MPGVGRQERPAANAAHVEKAVRAAGAKNAVEIGNVGMRGPCVCVLVSWPSLRNRPFRNVQHGKKGPRCKAAKKRLTRFVRYYCAAAQKDQSPRQLQPGWPRSPACGRYHMLASQETRVGNHDWFCYVSFALL